jgi:hypothetical protein
VIGFTETRQAVCQSAQVGMQVGMQVSLQVGYGYTRSVVQNLSSRRMQTQGPEFFEAAP